MISCSTLLHACVSWLQAEELFDISKQSNCITPKGKYFDILTRDENPEQSRLGKKWRHCHKRSRESNGLPFPVERCFYLSEQTRRRYLGDGLSFLCIGKSLKVRVVERYKKCRREGFLYTRNTLFAQRIKVKYWWREIWPLWYLSAISDLSYPNHLGDSFLLICQILILHLHLINPAPSAS